MNLHNLKGLDGWILACYFLLWKESQGIVNMSADSGMLENFTFYFLFFIIKNFLIKFMDYYNINKGSLSINIMSYLFFL